LDGVRSGCCDRGFEQEHYEANSLAIAIAGLGLLVVVDLLSPLAWREEIERIEPP
jgi:hypothetical protein